MWSKKFDKCVECGTAEVRHWAKGLCSKCYVRNHYVANKAEITQKHDKYRSANREKLRQSNREYKANNLDHVMAKNRKRLSDIYFGGMREKALARDHNQCVKCGSADNLVVHHIDGSGQSNRLGVDVVAGAINNTLANLQTLCSSCHMHEHQIRDKRWSRKHACCIDCGTTETRHHSRGLCTNCYQLQLYHAKKKPK